MSKPALGKGLGALIPRGTLEAAGTNNAVVEIDVTRILPNKYQPRKAFDDAALAGLAESIKENGVIQPVLVTRRPDGGYELIAGERRLRASMLAGRKKVPAIVREVAPVAAMELALIENIQREDLNPIETAEAYERLMGEFGLTQEDMARKVGKERSTVANFLRLLALPPEVKLDVAGGALSMGHAKAVLSLDTPAKQMSLRREIISRGLSVREAESMAKRMKAPGKVAVKKGREASAQVAMLEDELKRKLGTKVHIKQTRRSAPTNL
ncbi:MAG: ParB/RepB/Spo0J family partition protein [Nitrospirae bacterium]|nr:ParB/RepB/Spo0J family partition protein [Nitrospirota bacterium]